MMRLLTVVIAAGFAAVAMSASASGQSKLAGQALAERLCAKCHAIDKTGHSPLKKAPPFRVIANRYSVWLLQEALAEGIVTGHEAMPEFTLKPDEIADLLTFMDTLTAPKSKHQ